MSGTNQTRNKRDLADDDCPGKREGRANQKRYSPVLQAPRWSNPVRSSMNGLATGEGKALLRASVVPVFERVSGERRSLTVKSINMSDNPTEISSKPGLDELISLSKAAELSGLTQPHLALLVRQGKLWGHKIGRNWVTTEKAVREYLARDRRPGPKTN